MIHASEALLPSLEPVEIVERKGIGHPDTICDALAEQVSLALCRHYLQRFGRILHHNVDKVLLCGGAASPIFGGGEILEPMELYVAGRVTTHYGGESIPAAELAVQACREWLASHLPALDVERHVRITPRFHPVSAALAGLFGQGESAPLSNDTSCGVGFAPFTPLESAVLTIERELNSSATHTAHPAIGQDIKVVGVRRGDRIQFTIACAMIASHVDSIARYKEAIETVRRIALQSARRFTDLHLEAAVNLADDLSRGLAYLTVTGTSAEAGDDGETGRGNRTSGLITPYRPMTIEAAAGKNPVNHVGKLYNIAAGSLAARIARDVPGHPAATCILVSQIGRPIDDPQLADVRLVLEPGQTLDAVRQPIRDLLQQELSRLKDPQSALLQQGVMLY